MIARYVLALVVIGLAWFVMVQIAMAAEQREPFKWSLVMQLPGKPAEARWLFDSETACNLDLASSANAAPKGTRFQCQRRKP